MMYSSSHQRCSLKKGCLRNFTKFIGKHLCQGLFYITATLLKKRLWHMYFPVNFVKFLRTTFLQKTSGRLLLHVACFAKVSLFLLKSCNIKVIVTVRFTIKKLAHIKWDVIISSSLRLFLKLWIWFRCQNRNFLSPWRRIISF